MHWLCSMTDASGFRLFGLLSGSWRESFASWKGCPEDAGLGTPDVNWIDDQHASTPVLKQPLSGQKKHMH